MAAIEALLCALSAEVDPPTTVREPDRALDLHVADSLAGLEMPDLAGAARVADVGAGAGFPGLPLAVAMPSADVDLLEATARKCAVIERLAGAAGIPNARAVSARAEEWATGAGSCAYEAVTARAVAALPVLVEYAAPLLREGGVFVAWKGARRPDEERRAAVAAAELELAPGEVRRVEPFAGARDRHLHLYRKVGPTPSTFPRRPGIARKRPLGGG